MSIEFLTAEDRDSLQNQINDLQTQINGLTGGGVAPIFYDNTPPIENFTQITPTTGTPYRYYAISQINIGAMSAGEHIHAFGSFSMTHNFNYMMQSSGFLRLHEGQGPQSLLVTSAQLFHDTWPGQYISQFWAENWDNKVHHKICPNTGMIQLDQDYTDAWVTLIGYAASTSWTSGNITVDQSYGNLYALRFPPGSIA